MLACRLQIGPVFRNSISLNLNMFVNHNGWLCLVSITDLIFADFDAWDGWWGVIVEAIAAPLEDTPYELDYDVGSLWM